MENRYTVKFGKLLVERRVSLEGRIKLEFLVFVSKNGCSVCYSSEARDFLCNNIKHPKFIQRIEGFFVKKVALLNLSGLLIPRFPIFFAKFLKPRKYSDTRKNEHGFPPPNFKPTSGKKYKNASFDEFTFVHNNILQYAICRYIFLTVELNF